MTSTSRIFPAVSTSLPLPPIFPAHIPCDEGGSLEGRVKGGPYISEVSVSTYTNQATNRTIPSDNPNETMCNFAFMK